MNIDHEDWTIMKQLKIFITGSGITRLLNSDDAPSDQLCLILNIFESKVHKLLFIVLPINCIIVAYKSLIILISLTSLQIEFYLMIRIQ